MEFKRTLTVAEMVEMAEQGHTLRAIGQLGNITRQRVAQLIQPHFTRPPAYKPRCLLCGTMTHGTKGYCRQHLPWTHGTSTGYRARGCRCKECRAWNANLYKRRRARKACEE